MEDVLDHTCLHLAFYLASWGMLRNSFLLQKDYKVHTYFIRNVFMNPNNNRFFDSNDGVIDHNAIAGVNNLIQETRLAYIENVNEKNAESAVINITDTLASKILLGVYGNVPAYERNFKDGLALFGIRTQFDETGCQVFVVR